MILWNWDDSTYAECKVIYRILLQRKTSILLYINLIFNSSYMICTHSCQTSYPPAQMHFVVTGFKCFVLNKIFYLNTYSVDYSYIVYIYVYIFNIINTDYGKFTVKKLRYCTRMASLQKTKTSRNYTLAIIKVCIYLLTRTKH